MEIRDEPLSFLETYATIPIAFRVERILELSANGLGGLVLEERVVPSPYAKDYDAEPGNRPTDWPERFDLSRWGVLSAQLDGQLVGGAVLAFDTPDLHMLRGRKDLVVLWDLRVSPQARRRGVGRALFAAAESWAQARGCTQLVVETQNVNVPACRFYAGQGCSLVTVDRLAYPELPDEIQLLWCKELAK